MANQTTVQLKRSSVAGKVPDSANVEVGEPVVNLADKKVYTKNVSGNIIQIASGNLQGLADVSNASPSSNQVLAWNNSTKLWAPTTINSGGGTTYVRFEFTSSNDQIIFSGIDDLSQTLSIDNTDAVDVYLNGVRLIKNTDFYAYSSNITLVEGAVSNDKISIVTSVAGTSLGVSSVGGATGAVSNVQLADAVEQTGRLSTANVYEVNNLYFTNARSYSNVIQIGYITSSALNGYSTNAQLSSYVTIEVADNAYNQANIAYTTATTSFDKANTSYTVATTAFDKANTSYTVATTAFDKANSSYTVATTAFDTANTAYTTATLAFDGANTSVKTVAGVTSTSISNAQIAAGISRANIANLTISGDINIGGNISVSGNVTRFSANDLIISDPLIYIGEGNSGDLLDLGLISSFTNPTYQHSGLVRDASDGIWKLFANVEAEPTTTVDFTNATYSPIRVGALTATTGNFSGNVDTGNVSGTVGTFTNSRLGTVQTGTWNGSSISTTFTDAKITSVANQTGAISNTQLSSAVQQTGILTTANVTEVTNLYYTDTRTTANVRTLLTTPPAIGGTTANSGSFTTVTATTPIVLTSGGTGSNSAPGAFAAITGYTTTATAGGTTTLTNASNVNQYFTGTSAQTVQLPDVTTLTLGWTFDIANNSTKILTVNSSGGNLVGTVSPGATVMATCISTTGTTAASWDFGYMELSVDTRLVPQNAQTGNYTADTTDIGKHIFHALGAAAATYTIPANSAVPYENGTALTFVNLSANAVSIQITTDTLYLAGTGSTGTRSLAQYGIATALKMTSTTWIISGSGLT